jgi:DNA-binding CsgD family transcriptional regulator
MPASPELPSPVAAVAESITNLCGDPRALRHVVDGCQVPLATASRDRRFTYVNPSARLLLRKSSHELRESAVEEVFAPESRHIVLGAWEEMLASGATRGLGTLVFGDGSQLELAYWGLAEPCPGTYLLAASPAAWNDRELDRAHGLGDEEDSALTEREIEVLRLVAEGRSSRRIAELLVISESTVKTHLTHVYTKLGVSDRAAAVAHAMRLGLIA